MVLSLEVGKNNEQKTKEMIDSVEYVSFLIYLTRLL